MTVEFTQLLKPAIALAKEAGRAILPYWNAIETLDVILKADQSPQTAADLAANQILIKGLTKLANFPILSEESEIPDFAIRQNWDCYWLLDPIDGTRGFIRQSAEFSVNIALIKQHNPVLGVIYAPITQECYYATRGYGAFKQIADQNEQAIQTHYLGSTEIAKIILGQFHNSKHLQRRMKTQIDFPILRLNSSLKFGKIAEGIADIYPRFGVTCEWDTAAGQCILVEAGGGVFNLNGRNLQYNCKAQLANSDFIAIGDLSQKDYWLNLFNMENEQ